MMIIINRLLFLVAITSCFQITLFSFYKNARLIFKNKLKTIPAPAEKQSLKFSIKVMNKIAASATQFAKCILLHAYSCTTATPSCISTNKT